MSAQIRCAIYTRKSTDEGLEQDFNSLHAQREACESFILSQRHEGWRAIRDAFDDGGFSGGTHRNNVQLGQYGRNRSNVWHYPGINTLRRQSGEGDLLALHPTVKPVAMIADAIMDCSARGGLVLDPFLGSGSTIIAAERTGRRCFGLEIDPLYVDTIVRRWQAYTGEVARHAVSGRSFAEIEAEIEANHAR
jgi:DNA modification methylase